MSLRINDGEEIFNKLPEGFLVFHAKIVQPPHPPKWLGDYCLTMWENKTFWFVADQSLEHLPKRAKSMDIECIVVKFLRVLAPGYGVAYNVHTLRSIAKQQPCKITISDLPPYKCFDFISIKSYALGKNGCHI
jgi:hypothetical protein